MNPGLKSCGGSETDVRSKKFLTDTGNDNVGHNFSGFSGSASGLKTRREQSASDPGVATRSTLGLAEMRLQQHTTACVIGRCASDLTEY